MQITITEEMYKIIIFLLQKKIDSVKGKIIRLNGNKEMAKENAKLFIDILDNLKKQREAQVE